MSREAMPRLKMLSVNRCRLTLVEVSTKVSAKRITYEAQSLSHRETVDVVCIET